MMMRNIIEKAFWAGVYYDDDARATDDENFDEIIDSILAETQKAEIGALNEQLAETYKRLSGRIAHDSDCATSCSPAETPRPCDCSK